MEIENKNIDEKTGLVIGSCPPGHLHATIASSVNFIGGAVMVFTQSYAGENGERLKCFEGGEGMDREQNETIYTPHTIDRAGGQYARVRKEMKNLGGPTIRVIDGGDCLLAVEGCHRIQAAAELGEPVTAVILSLAQIRRGLTLHGKRYRGQALYDYAGVTSSSGVAVCRTYRH